MAIKKSVPAQEQKIEKTLRTKAEAEAFAKERKKFYKEAGYSTRYDIKLVTWSNEWQVTMYIYLDD